MEIERLPLGQSHADKCRAGNLRWRNMPQVPGFAILMPTHAQFSISHRVVCQWLSHCDHKLRLNPDQLKSFLLGIERATARNALPIASNCSRLA
jgi:hypothetical protein